MPQAHDELRLYKFIASAYKFRLVALDELGFVPFTPTGAQALFTFCIELYERVAVIVTTNLKFADWRSGTKDLLPLYWGKIQNSGIAGNIMGKSQFCSTLFY